MRAVGICRREYDFRVARQLDLTCRRRSVEQRNTTDFSAVVGRYGYFCLRVDSAVAPHERDAVARKTDAIPLRLDTGRLERGGPNLTARGVAHVTPLSVVVTRAVVSPSRHGKIAVLTV